MEDPLKITVEHDPSDPHDERSGLPEAFRQDRWCRACRCVRPRAGEWRKVWRDGVEIAMCPQCAGRHSARVSP